METVEQVLCACGCGQSRPAVKCNGYRARFINGHNGRKYHGDVKSVVAQAKKTWRRNNPQSVAKFRKDYYHQRKLRAMAYLGNKCLACGLAYNGKNAPVFEFDHRDPASKDYGVTRMLVNASWCRIVKELDKCDLKCANCHNMRHGGEW